MCEGVKGVLMQEGGRMRHGSGVGNSECCIHICTIFLHLVQMIEGEIT